LNVESSTGSETDQQPSDAGHSKKRTRKILQLAVTVLLLGLLVHLVGWQALVDARANASLPWLFAMWCVAVATFAVMALNLYLLLNKLGLKITYGRVLLANALANFYSLIVPGDLMAGLSKWAVLSVATRNSAASLSAIVINKIALAIPPVILGSTALVLQNPFPDLPIAEMAGYCMLLIAIVLMLGLSTRTGTFIDRLLLSLSRRLPARLHRGFTSLVDSFQRFRRFRKSDHLAIVLVAFIAFSTGLVAFYCATRTFGVDVPFMTLVWISLALFLSGLLPLTFNNLGVREGLLVLAFSNYGVAAAKAIGVGLAMFSSSILIGLIGGMCQMALALDWKKLQ
jgi:uncharacterized membrane protein YbhN (UPF0104 family)